MDKLHGVSEVCNQIKDKFEVVEEIRERLDRKFKEKLSDAGQQIIEMKDAKTLLKKLPAASASRK